MIVVNLFAGCGCGKSTGAAYVFSKLKMMGYNCELVTEFAKDKTWENNLKVFDNQAYIFGKQYFKITRLHNEVDLIVTDSPLLLSIIYNQNPILGENFNNMVFDVFNSYRNINFLLNRVKKYNPKGRNQTEEEAKKIDINVKTLLDEKSVHYTVVDGNFDGYEYIIKSIIKEIK